MAVPDGRIIKSDNETLAKYATNYVAKNFEVEVQTLVQAAKSQAVQLVASAQGEVEGIRKTAREEGYQAGLAQGKKEGYDAGLKEGQKAGDSRAYSERATETQKALGMLSKSLSEMIRFFEANHEAILRQASAELMNLSIAIAEKVILTHLQNDRDLICRNVEEAISLCGRCTEVDIRVHPELVTRLESYTPDLKRIFDGLQQIRLIPDDTLQPGDTVIRTPETEIQGKILDKLREIYSNLFYHPGDRIDNGTQFPPIPSLQPGAKVEPPAPQ